MQIPLSINCGGGDGGGGWWLVGGGGNFKLIGEKKILQYVDRNICKLYDKLINITFAYFDNEYGN